MSIDVPLHSEKTDTRMGCWPVLVTLLILGIGLVRLIAEVIETAGNPSPLGDMLWSLGITLLLATVLALLRWRAQSIRLRACYTTWLLSLLPSLFLLPVLWIAPAYSQQALFIQATLLGIYALCVRWIVGPRTTRGTRPQAVWMALFCVMLLGYPWLVWGSLGSLTDIALSVLIAGLFGWSAAQILARFWLRSYKLAASTPGRDLFVGGWVVTIALLLMVRNLGFNGGSMVLALLCLTLGWLVMAVSSLGFNTQRKAALNWLAIAILVGGSMAFPLLFTDSDTLPLLYVFQAEAGLWAWLAALISMAGVLLLTLVVRLSQRWLMGPLSRWVVVVAFVLSGVGAGVIYTIWGTPGLYGDALFVILRDQADLTTITEVQPHAARRQAVYDSLVAHANHTQSELRQDLSRWGLAYEPYYLVNGVQVEGNLLVAWWLARHPAVDRVVPAPLLRPLPVSPSGMGGEEITPITAMLWNLEAVEAERAWIELGIRGEGIVIGQSDTGVQWDHPQLQSGYRGATGVEVDHNYHWFDPWQQSPIPIDVIGHGTHTLGTAVGDDVGVAPDASWISCRNMERNLGNAAYYLDCLQFMLAPFPLNGDPLLDGDPQRAAHVLNNSWGCPQATEGCDPRTLQPAFDALRTAGLFVVVSAGNDGPACSSLDAAPAIYDAGFTVGASTATADLAPFSSVGPVLSDGSNRIKPDLLAPGVEILSSLPIDVYGPADGTSSAGPHVAGVVALMWSANPALIGDIETTEQILIDTATPFTGTVLTMPFILSEPCDLSIDGSPNIFAGYGIVNAYRAVERALALASQ